MIQTETKTIPTGDRGAYATLREMRRLVLKSMASVMVLDEAKQIIRSVGGKNRLAQAQAIAGYMASSLRFVRDPWGVELIHTPEFMIERIHRNGMYEADCDDYAILSAALAKAIGLRTKFVILGFAGSSGPWSHVYTIAETPQGWVPFDVSFGIPDGAITRKAYYEV